MEGVTVYYNPKLLEDKSFFIITPGAGKEVALEMLKNKPEIEKVEVIDIFGEKKTYRRLNE